MLHENLKKTRIGKGMSQEQLALRLNVVRQTVSKWEKGTSVPDADTLLRLSEVLETPVNELLGEAPLQEPAELSDIALQLAHMNELTALKMQQERDMDLLCSLVTDFYYRLASISGNTFMSLLYRSTAEPQGCVYRMYFEKNGNETTVNTCKKLVELLLARDAEGAKSLMITALNTALQGEMAVV